MSDEIIKRSSINSSNFLRDKIILSVDLGGTSGFALWLGNNLVKSWFKNVNSSKDTKPEKETKYNNCSRLTQQLNIAENYVRENNLKPPFEPALDMVVVEDPFGQYIQGVKVLHIYMGAVIQWCIDRKVSFAKINDKTIKKVFTGNGNANKDLMVFTAQDKYGDHIVDENEADAVAVGYTYLNQF